MNLRTDANFHGAARVEKVAIDHVADHAAGSVDDRAGCGGLIRHARAHRSRTPDARQLPHESRRARVNAHEVKPAATFGPAIKWLKPESDLIGRPGGDRDVFARVPVGPSPRFLPELDPPSNWLGHAFRRLAASERARGASNQGLQRDGGGGLRVAVIFSEESVDDPGAEQKSVVLADAHESAIRSAEWFASPPAVDEAGEQPFRRPTPHADCVGDGVHGAPAEKREPRQRSLPVDFDESGHGDVIGAVAAADRQYVDFISRKIEGDGAKFVSRPRSADLSTSADDRSEARGRPWIAQVLATAGIEDDADTQHEDMLRSAARSRQSVAGLAVARYTEVVPTHQEQLEAARAGAVIVFRPDLASVVVRGTDRVQWLNGLLTCDLVRAVAGTASYGLALTQKGRILADVIVLADADALRLIVPREAVSELVTTLERYIIMEDAELAPADDVVALAYGPQSLALCGEGVTLAAFDPLGGGGAALLIAGEVDAVAGLHGEHDLFEALRIAAGVPRFGFDFDVTTYPQEALLERRAVSFDKGCYLGQEVVCMLELRGHVKRKLARVAVGGSEEPTRGSEVRDPLGAVVGALTSVTRSPISGEIVGLAMLKLAKTVAGTELLVGGCRAEVLA